MTYSAVNFPCSVQFSSWYITWTWLMCGDRWHNTIILRKRKGATDTDTLVSRVQRVCRSDRRVQANVRASYLKVLAFGPGNVNDLHGFRRVDFFAWIMCFSYWSSVIVRWNLKESHRSADPAGVVLSLLSSPRLHVIQANHAGMLLLLF